MYEFGWLLIIEVLRYQSSKDLSKFPMMPLPHLDWNRHMVIVFLVDNWTRTKIGFALLWKTTSLFWCWSTHYIWCNMDFFFFLLTVVVAQARSFSTTCSLPSCTVRRKNWNFCRFFWNSYSKSWWRPHRSFYVQHTLWSESCLKLQDK